MKSDLLLIVPILLPILTGLLTGFFRPLGKPRLLRPFFVLSLFLNLALVIAISLMPEMRLALFSLAQHMPVLFKADDPALFFCLLTSVMFLFAGIYGCEYMKHEGGESRFYMFFLIVLGMLMGFGLSGNLITVYIFFEIMTLFSVPLVMHSMKKEAITAGFKFLYYSIAGAALAFVAILFLFTLGIPLEFTPGGVLNAVNVAGSERQILTVTLLAIIGFSAKAGMFPLHAWLPDAHPVAPAPASAILSGIITKAGVFAVLRFVFYLIGADFIRGSWVQTVWLSLALFTVATGALLALREPVLKRRIAYSSISQVSYIMFGLATLTARGLTGALLHTVFHSIMKHALFFAAGAIVMVTKRTEAAELRGIGKQMPATMWSFAVLAISVAGIPLSSGFVSKWYIATGALSAEIGFFAWLGPAILLFSALLSTAYLLSIAIDALYDPEQRNAPGIRDPGMLMRAPIILFAAAAIILGVIPGFLISFFETIAIAVT
ncbi:MAG: proton-conducting membrane transporter [Clostridiales bacterium]|nr:proton-conducting membrane transporter [Clostridiales bacterium]